jgi:bifunctional non-homologous end joining protein LigD
MAALDEYRAKRHFERTPEPAGRAPAPGSEPGLQEVGRFVVQRHRARRLHYDLRLEIDGVLVSWAVPKGPTLDPTARRLAVHVEDHPVEYFDFEGVIPSGEYGGGDVIVWDWGTWSVDPGVDAAAAVRGGDLHVDLRGEKLAGRFVLVRKGRDGAPEGREQWLLLHKADAHAAAGWDPEAHPRSVKSGRTNDQVAADPEALWDSDAPAAFAAVRLGGGAWPPVDDAVVDALDRLDGAGTLVVDDREVRLTNLDKVLFPGRGSEPAVTKRDLVRYQLAVAPFALPYLADRPVNRHRYPDGAGAKGFWHKSVPDHAPGWLTRWRNPHADPGETECYPVVDSPAALAWMANDGSLELHPWTSTAARPEEPTWALIDIDPGERTSWEDVLVLARLHRTALEHLGLAGGAKVTGRRGIQIWVPVARGCTFAETRAWVETLSRAVGATVPELVSWSWRRSERKGLARLDYTQNAVNKTLVAPFSTRPAPGAPVSVPIEWDELDDPELRPDRWTVRSVPARLTERGDPLRPLIGRQQHLPAL